MAISGFFSDLLQTPAGQTLLFLSAASLVKLLMLNKASEKDEEKEEPESRPKELVGTVTKLFYYPVKSCCGVELTTAKCEAAGLRSADGILDRSGVGDQLNSYRQLL